MSYKRSDKASVLSFFVRYIVQEAAFGGRSRRFCTIFRAIFGITESNTTTELRLSDSIVTLPDNDIVILIMTGKGERLAESEIQ